MATKSKAKPKDLGTGGARKAADAIVKRKKANEAALKAAGTGGKKAAESKPKASAPLDMSNPKAYREYQLRKAKEDAAKRKAKKK